MDECRSKQLLLAKMKVLESNFGLDSNSEPDKGKWIIDVEPSATITTTKIQPKELEELKEGEYFFHS